MMKLDNFVGMMTGHFDNKDQFNKMQKRNSVIRQIPGGKVYDET